MSADSQRRNPHEEKLKMKWISASGPAGNCVAVARKGNDLFLVKDTKFDKPDVEGESPILPFTFKGWVDLCDRVEGGDLDIGRDATSIGRRIFADEVIIERASADEWIWTSRVDETLGSLSFSLVEHEAFLIAVENESFTAVEEGGTLESDEDVVADFANHC